LEYIAFLFAIIMLCTKRLLSPFLSLSLSLSLPASTIDILFRIPNPSFDTEKYKDPVHYIMEKCGAQNRREAMMMSKNAFLFIYYALS